MALEGGAEAPDEARSRSRSISFCYLSWPPANKEIKTKSIKGKKVPKFSNSSIIRKRQKKPRIRKRNKNKGNHGHQSPIRDILIFYLNWRSYFKYKGFHLHNKIHLFKRFLSGENKSRKSLEIYSKDLNVNSKRHHCSNLTPQGITQILFQEVLRGIRLLPFGLPAGGPSRHESDSDQAIQWEVGPIG